MFLDTSLSAILFNILHAVPLKSKCSLKSLSVRLSFIDKNTKLLLVKSSQTHSAVSYYEKDNPVINYIMPVMTSSCDFTIDK